MAYIKKLHDADGNLYATVEGYGGGGVFIIPPEDVGEGMVGLGWQDVKALRLALKEAGRYARGN